MKTNPTQTLDEADRLWSQSAPDLEEFLSFIADDVIWLFCGRPPIRGKAEVRSHFQPTFAKPGFSLTWTPERIDVGDAGDIGYVFGTWKTAAEDASGHLSEKTGPYATIWKKRTDGKWQVVLEADY